MVMITYLYIGIGMIILVNLYGAHQVSAYRYFIVLLFSIPYSFLTCNSLGILLSAWPTTDPIFISFNTPEKALVASGNKSFTGITPKINSSVKEVEWTNKGKDNDTKTYTNKEKTIKKTQ